MNYPTVIVRAFADEPFKMLARAAGNRRVEVSRSEGGETLSIFDVLVYEYDADLYERMRAAFGSRDLVALLALWKQAKQFVPTEAAAAGDG